MDKKDYVKVLYESNPIGENGIVLKLTTFDLDQWKKDQQLKEIPKTQKGIYVEVERTQMLEPDFLPKLQAQLNHLIIDNYERQMVEMKQELEFLRNIKIVPIEYGDKDEG